MVVMLAVEGARLREMKKEVDESANLNVAKMGQLMAHRKRGAEKRCGEKEGQMGRPEKSGLSGRWANATRGGTLVTPVTTHAADLWSPWVP